MDMKIFIADDSTSDSSQICRQLNNWAERKSAHLKMDCFQELSYDRIAEACSYDIIFLDIELPYINGMEFAKLVRQHNERIPIAFFTSHRELAVSGYDVQAMSYLVKPCKQVDIDNCMDRLYKNKMQQKAPQIMIQTTQIDCYEISQIIYIEAVGHYTDLYTVDHCIAYHLPFKDIDKLLPRPPFFNCYRSYTVNMDYVCGVNNQEILLSHNKKIPLSKACANDFKNALLQLHKGVQL